MSTPNQPLSAARARIDLWLWRARFAKTRASAAALVSAGGVRLIRGGQARLIDKPSVALATGDRLLVPLGGTLRAVRVLALGARRGPAAEARTLYEVLAPSLDEADSDGHVSGAQAQKGPRE